MNQFDFYRNPHGQDARVTTALFIALFLACFADTSFAQTIQIVCDQTITKATIKLSKSGSSEITGKVTDHSAVFENLPANAAFDASLRLSAGITLQGIDMTWYSTEKARDDTEPLNDDDRQQIQTQATAITSFYNKSRILKLVGTHDRAVALVERIRDKGFHSNKGDEVIWHIELWYLKNQHGGWEHVQQTNRLVRRERFASSVEFKKTVDSIRWVPALGHLMSPGDQSTLTVTLQPGDVSGDEASASSQPARQ